MTTKEIIVSSLNGATKHNNTLCPQTKMEMSVKILQQNGGLKYDPQYFKGKFIKWTK
jgi:hypothetical protein